MRRLVAPLGMSGKSARRGTKLRIAGAAVLLAVGFGELLTIRGGTELLKPLAGFLFVAAGSALMAHAWVRAGVADPFHIADLIADGETPRSIMKRSA